jgi:hypothetical protein
MTFEEWLEDKLDRAMKQSAKTATERPATWGAGYDRGYVDALQYIFCQLPPPVANADGPVR